MKVALYARVSTLLNQDPELQLIQLRQVAKNRGFTVVKEYVDRGISGGQESRPALNEMMKATVRKDFDFVLVTALDRIGRNTKHVLTLMDDFHKKGISLISLREGLDFSTPTGQLVLTVLAGVATLERQIISERIRTSLAAKKLLAQQTNSGWRCGPKRKVTKEVESQICMLRRDGVSIRMIAKRLGISKTSVLRVVQKGGLGQQVAEAI